MTERGRDSVGLRGLYIPTLAATVHGAASLLFAGTVIGDEPLLHVGASAFFGAGLMMIVLGLVEARATTGRLSEFWRAFVLQPSSWASRGGRPPS